MDWKLQFDLKKYTKIMRMYKNIKHKNEKKFTNEKDTN